MKVKVNGVELNCRIEGKKGAPWITLSHALCNNLSLWDDHIPVLKYRYRILRYDQRGHGASPPVAGPYTFPMLIADVIALWDELGIAKEPLVRAVDRRHDRLRAGAGSRRPLAFSDRV